MTVKRIVEYISRVYDAKEVTIIAPDHTILFSNNPEKFLQGGIKQ